MTEMRKVQSSLLERAAQVYDFDAHLRARQAPIAPLTDLPEFERDPAIQPMRQQATPQAAAAAYQAPRTGGGGFAQIDRALLTKKGMLVPNTPIGALVEEFRQAKRQLLLTARAIRATDTDRARSILVCSANANDGKTYCAINLAISMAAERETEVLLIDGDIAKPDVMTQLGLQEGPGLLDALADPSVDVENYIIATDIPQLSLLPAGTRSNTDTELLTSGRTPALIAQLLAADPRRILIFDSPPALAASPASVLAGDIGQVMLVVRADKTSENDLREAVAQLNGCENIQLIINAVSFSPTGRRFGSYYGQEDAE